MIRDEIREYFENEIILSKIVIWEENKQANKQNIQVFANELIESVTKEYTEWSMSFSCDRDTLNIPLPSGL